jgi:hypothetical protein
MDQSGKNAHPPPNTTQLSPKIFFRRFAYNFPLPTHTVLIIVQSGPYAAAHSLRVRVLGRRLAHDGPQTSYFWGFYALTPLLSIVYGGLIVR